MIIHPRASRLCSVIVFALSPFCAHAQTLTPGADAYYHFMLGSYYEQKLSFSGSQADASHAIEEYRHASLSAPESHEVAEALALTLARSGHMQEAIAGLRDYLQKHPQQSDAQRLLGRIYLSLSGLGEGAKTSPEMVARAREQYAALAQSAAATDDDRVALGRLCKAAGDLPAAEAAWLGALEHNPAETRARLSLSDLYAEQSRFGEQMKLLEATPQPQRGAEVLQRLAQLYERNERWAEASAQRRQLLPPPNSPLYAEAQQALARDLWREGRRDEALALFKADGSAENAAEKLFGRAVFEEQVFEYELALADYQQAQKHPALQRRASLRSAACLASLGREEEAVKLLRNLEPSLLADKNETPDGMELRAELYSQLGEAERQRGRTEASVQAYERLIAQGENYAEEGWGQIVESYRMAREWKQAAASAEKAAAATNSANLSLLNLSWQANMGDYERSMSTLASLLQKSPGDCDILLAIANAEAAHGRTAEATAHVEACVEGARKTQQEGPAHILAASFFDRQRNFPRAIAEMRAGVGMINENASAFNSLGYILTEAGENYEEASALLTRALRQEPANAAFLDSMGWLLFRKKDFAAAEGYLKRSLARQENDPEVHGHMAQLYAATGRPELALREWRRAVQLWSETPLGELDPISYQEAREHLKQLQGQTHPARP